MLYQVCVSWSHFDCLAFISFLFALQQHQSSSSVLDCRVEPSQAEPNRAESIINSSSRSSIHITFHKPSRVESNWGKRRRSPAGMMTNDRRSKRRAKMEDGRGPFVSQSAAMKSFSLFCFSFRIVRETSMVVWFHITFTALLLLLLLAVGIGIACTLSRPFKFSVHFYFYS